MYLYCHQHCNPKWYGLIKVRSTVPAASQYVAQVHHWILHIHDRLASKRQDSSLIALHDHPFGWIRWSTPGVIKIAVEMISDVLLLFVEYIMNLCFIFTLKKLICLVPRYHSGPFFTIYKYLIVITKCTIVDIWIKCTSYWVCWKVFTI